MLPLLSLHAIATQRGDGLHPVLLAGLRHIAADRVEQVATGPGCEEKEDGLGQARAALRAKALRRGAPPKGR